VRRMRMIWGLTVAAALAGSLLMASPAGAVSAKKPLQGSFHEEFSFDIDCGTFLLHEDVVEDGAFTVFFDADGAPMNVIVHHHFHGGITNRLARRSTIAGTGRSSSTWRLRRMTSRTTSWRRRDRSSGSASPARASSSRTPG
jgi:hypothetical protein